jgi:hypothetical protein
MLRTSRILSLALAAAMFMAPAAANGATKKKVPYPTISSISPKKLAVGEKLTIRGTNFRPGKRSNTIVFKRDGKTGVFVKSDLSTRKMMTVKVPTKVGALLAAGGQPTVFRLRVITSRFAKSYTPASQSPLILPQAAGDTVPGGVASGSNPGTVAPAPAPLSPYEACQASAAANAGADADGDGLASGLEQGLRTDPCTADTDGDGLGDGYEYQSAKDLNSFAVPYPGAKPWPNPLDPTDANYDFDGDGLQLWQEHTLWKYSGGQFKADGGLPYYSDGTQNSGGSLPASTVALVKLDLDGNGYVTDDERDAEGDGLSNMVEYNFRGTQGWWIGVYKNEKPYLPAKFYELDAINPDTDGDGVPDGADDQDHDGWSNYDEMQLSRGGSGIRVQPYNPCLPDPYSRTCSRYIPLDPTTAWPPFDGSEPANALIPFDTAGTVDPIAGHGWDGTGGPQN